MKILLIRGAPRDNGATNIFADAFVQGAKKFAQIDDINVCKKNISACRGCYACVKSANAKCVIDDDMQKLLQLFETCNAVVFFTPVYFYGMSSQLKMFFDRCFPIIAKRNTPLGNPEKLSKSMLTFSVASNRLWAFDAITKNFEMIATELGMSLSANIRRTEAVYFSELGNSSIRIKKILSATTTAGEEFAKNLVISKETLNTIELPIALSDKIFKQRSIAYWGGIKNK